MLRKMYLVSPEYVSHRLPPAPPTPAPQQQPKAAMPKSKQRRRRETKNKQHPHGKWVKLKRKLQDADITRKTLIGKIANFLQSVLPYGGTSAGQAPMPPPATPDVQAGLMTEAPDTASPSLPFLSRAHESVFASPIKRSLSMDSDEGEASYVPGEATVKAFSEQQFGAVASLYVATYVFRTGNIDKDFGMRIDVDGTFRIGTAEVEINRDLNMFVQSKSYKGTRRLFELLTRKEVARSFITDSDLRSYIEILEATHAILKITIHRVL